MLLITIFVELRVVAGRSRTQAVIPQAVSRRPCCAVALRRTAWSEHGMDAAWAWHGKCESATAALCKSNGKDHVLNPYRHGIAGGTAWARHGHGMICVNRPLLVAKDSRLCPAQTTAKVKYKLHSQKLYFCLKRGRKVQ